MLDLRNAIAALGVAGVSCTCPVAIFFTCKEAFGMTGPEESVTVPEMALA
jgi:hypothetical protein